MRGMLSVQLLPALAGVMIIPQGFAQTLPASVIACAAETDMLERLACYDREVARYRTPTAAIAPPGGATVRPGSMLNPPPAAPEAAADFGVNGELKRKEGSAPPQPAKLETLTARIASISNRPTGQAIYTFESGQIWIEAETESHLPLHQGEEVTIKRGVLGAFYLSSAEVRGLRVKRVR